MMDSRTRLLSAISGKEPDHVPLYCPVFGWKAPKDLRWKKYGREVKHWYTMRLEHIHTLPIEWDIEQDFLRVDRFFSLGLDDVLDVSVPWSVHPEVKTKDFKEAEEEETVLCREYDTPKGTLRHVVKKTSEEQGPGWVIQPDHPQLFEDFNIPRGLEHAVAKPQDLPKLRYLLREPKKEQLASFRERMAKIKEFSMDRKVLVQGWSAFGMDGIVWLCGVEGTVITAMDNPSFFQRLVDAMYDFDRMRTEILLDIGGVDMIVQRGWYSSTDFLSPSLFRRFVLPHLKDLCNMVHQAGVLFAYVMTTGLMSMLDELKESDIDLLYFVDPVQDEINLESFKQRLDGKFAIAGGINSGITLGRGKPEEIFEAVNSAIQTLAPGGGFILSPVDALYPDTPWDSVQKVVDAWCEQ